MSENLSEYVRVALEKAIQQEGEVRLISKGAATPGLFPAGTSKAKNEAIESCFVLSLLDKLREVEEGKGKSAKKCAFVKITPAGISALFACIPLERAQELLKAVSPSNLDAANEAFAKHSIDAMRKLEIEISDLLKKENTLFSLVHELMTERVVFLAQTRSTLESAFETFQKISAPVPPPRPSTTLPVSIKSAIPETEEDLDFQRDQCEQMVIAWEDAEGKEAKQALENVMHNLGLEAIGERDQVVPFDGRTHNADDPVEAGQPVVVIDPGWRLSNSRGVYLISKTRVKIEGI